MIGINIHGITVIKAEAKEFAGSHWLKLVFDDGNEIAIFFKHADTALAYASAINTVNDREVEEAYVPNENTVHIPAKVWRELNMGAPDAGKDTDTDR